MTFHEKIILLERAKFFTCNGPSKNIKHSFVKKEKKLKRKFCELKPLRSNGSQKQT